MGRNRAAEMERRNTLRPEKPKKKGKWITVTVNILFIAAICAVGWRIADHLIQSKESADLSERLWQQAAVTAQPERIEPAVTQEVASVWDEITPASDQNNDTTGSKTDAPEEITGIAETAVPNEIMDSAEMAGPEETTDNTEMNGSATGTETPVPKADEKETDLPAADNTPTVTDRTQETAETKQTVGENTSGDDLPETTKSRYPDDPNAPEQIDFDILRQVSKDAYAWLYAPETGINHPVMHTYNNDYYLTHMADGTKNKAGALFIDYRNAPALLDRNTIIYGHNMKDRSMFGQLVDYQDAEYCKAHPFMYLYIPDHRFRLEVVAAATTEDASEYYRFPVSWAEWKEMLQEAVELSAYDFSVSVNDTDHFVTLSTCAYDYQNERWIVICRVDDPEGILQKPLE